MNSSELNQAGSGLSGQATDRHMEGVSVSISAFNEVNSLEAMFRDAVRVVQELGIPYEICIVDDGSSDGTSELANQLVAGQPNAAVIHHSVNLGLGPTLRDCNASGTLPYCIGFPGDGQFPASIIPQYLPLIRNADIVLGYSSDVGKGRPPLLAFFSWAERLLIRILFGPFPHYQGVPMYRRSFLEGLNLTSTGRGWIVSMEIIIRAQRAGARIVSTPTPIFPREHGKSRATNLRNILSNLKQIFALWLHLMHEKADGPLRCDRH